MYQSKQHNIIEKRIFLSQLYEWAAAIAAIALIFNVVTIKHGTQAPLYHLAMWASIVLRYQFRH